MPLKNKKNPEKAYFLSFCCTYYFVFYNGSREAEDKVVLRLSDSFEKQNPGFEWTATMFNINHGHNKELMDNCKCLQDYALYVNMVREYIDKGYSSQDAAGMAVEDAIEAKLLNGFFARHKAEVMFSYLTDFDQNLYEKTIREESFEEGLEKGIEQGLEQGHEDEKVFVAMNMLKSDFSDEDIVKLTGISRELLESVKDKF